ncbi:hypothetical protein Nepgr_030101 [Nepenthes gracilis]|uniref:Secreted protein n=1 Tax=Nepenthes gracilis TaxID=150966 RepID=A0AAD3Y3W1_NEPGR|nr:hypothetical protein Nepgr_030101 [Nepenthes gracilis]
MMRLTERCSHCCFFAGTVLVLELLRNTDFLEYCCSCVDDIHLLGQHLNSVLLLLNGQLDVFGMPARCCCTASELSDGAVHLV